MMPVMTSMIDILARWPSRQSLADDAGVDLFAVHRWFQRGGFPGKHDAAILAGAAARGIDLSADEIVLARAHPPAPAAAAPADQGALPKRAGGSA